MRVDQYADLCLEHISYTQMVSTSSIVLRLLPVSNSRSMTRLDRV